MLLKFEQIKEHFFSAITSGHQKGIYISILTSQQNGIASLTLFTIKILIFLTTHLNNTL